jgi:transcriptional regulator of arginine metabolism
MNKASKQNNNSNHLELVDALKVLLLEGGVTSQEGICEQLEASGYAVNQSKVSRLLRKVGAIKTKNEHGQVVYRLPHEPAPPQLSDTIASLVISIMRNETTIVVNTSPGSAQLVARVIDYHKKELDVLAALAGDDTIFIAPNSNKAIQKSMDALKQLLF